MGKDDVTHEDDKSNTGDSALADKTALKAELALEIAAQGDYTSASYGAYTEKLAAAKAVDADSSATQKAVNQATAELKAARLGLTVRLVEAVDGANKELRMISGQSKEIVLADYINTNGLSKITYKVQASNEAITLSSVADGKFTATAGDVNGELDLKVSINVYYDNAPKLAVVLSVKITKEIDPIVFNEEFVKEYDVAILVNKESIVLNLAENVDNSGKLALTYSAKCDGEDLVLDGPL